MHTQAQLEQSVIEACKTKIKQLEAFIGTDPAVKSLLAGKSFQLVTRISTNRGQRWARYAIGIGPFADVSALERVRAGLFKHYEKEMLSLVQKKRALGESFTDDRTRAEIDRLERERTELQDQVSVSRGREKKARIETRSLTKSIDDDLAKLDQDIEKSEDDAKSGKPAYAGITKPKKVLSASLFGFERNPTLDELKSKKVSLVADQKRAQNKLQDVLRKETRERRSLEVAIAEKNKKITDARADPAYREKAKANDQYVIQRPYDNWHAPALEDEIAQEKDPGRKARLEGISEMLSLGSSPYPAKGFGHIRTIGSIR